jgi:hypothetical protein
VVGLAVSAGEAPGAGSGILGQQPDPSIIEDIHAFRAETWRWQQLMGVPPTPYYDHPEQDPISKYALWVRDLWRARALRAQRLALKPPHFRQFLCIHHFEGSWTDPGAPYFGGLQMDLTFMHQYGADLLRRKGTADHWTPLEQIWVAERAYRSGRGFYPWPNTARFCGLI